MSSVGEDDQRDGYYAYLGLAVIVGAGVLMGVAELQHIQKMSSSVGIAVFALLPFIIDLGLIGAAIVLWRSRLDGDEILRVAGWVVLGMVVIGLLATWTITHQNIRGRRFAHAPFVTVNNLSAGALIGFVFGWYDAFRRRHRQQVETERARLEFLHSSLRHNVLNGLNVILGRADLLEEQVTDADKNHLETIRSRSEELTRFTEATNALMENFLGHSAGTGRPLNLSAVLTEEVEKCQNQFDHAEFSLDISEDVYFEGDDLASELFSNLLSNAVIHNDKPSPEVSVTAHRSDGSVIVSVADNGPGIPDEEKDRVLEWNVRGVDSPGSGLGLAIADTVANRYDGRLWLEDNDPEGTIVKVELPVTDRNESDTTADALRTA